MRIALGGRDGTRRPSVPDLATAAVVVVAAAYLIWLSSRLWFMLDDFAFLLHREVTLVGDESLLLPHNDHWVTLPILVYRSMYHLAGLNFLPYGLLTIGLHLASCVLFAVLLRRLRADPWVVALMTGVLAFLGPGGLDILWAFQMGFLGPVAIAFGCMLLVDRGESFPTFPVAIWILLVAAVMFSGAGVTAVAWVAAFAWLRRGFISAVRVGAVPTIVYLCWFLAYGREASPAPPAPLDRIMPFVFRGLTSLWDAMVPVPWLGLAVLVVVTAVTLLWRQRPELRSFALAGLMALLLHYVLLAVSRAGWGVDTAASTRYLYVGLVLTLPAVAFTLQVLWDVLAPYVLPRALIWVALGVVLFGFGALELHRQAELLQRWQSGLPERMVAAAQLVDDGVPTLSTKPEPDVAPDIDTESLRQESFRSELPTIDPGPKAMLTVRSRLQVAISESPFGLGLAEGVRATRTRPVQPDAGCRTTRARTGAEVRLRAGDDGSQVRLTVARDLINTRLVSGGRRSPPTRRGVTPGKPTYVGTSAAGTTLIITVPSGAVTICSAGTITTRG